jgi:hypothetical protein
MESLQRSNDERKKGGECERNQRWAVGLVPEGVKWLEAKYRWGYPWSGPTGRVNIFVKRACKKPEKCGDTTIGYE